ncbi:hypothetical protein ABZT06_17890 [Streptomyces sp. NPDC005483]|uniref:hypothetical protein n=1 Tax=Streptomyces sp. NPDC005483 TaxID=3154882 RepID=UPI0033BAF4C5
MLALAGTTVQADGSSDDASFNADGTVVAFESASPDLVEGDTNGVSDVFLRTVQ